MPLYEYQCQECGETTEVLQKHSDPPLTICGNCGGQMKKLFSSPAIQFKGSGFYLTDYGRGGNAGSGGSKKNSGDGAGSSESNNSSSNSSSNSNSSSESSGSGEKKTSSSEGSGKAETKP